jgi:exodeoxyribonuclease VII large subunit
LKSSSKDIARKIYTVSELTALIKALLEESFPFVWITGEISNLRIPTSGHCYFTLKDEKAQINAVMFRGQLQNVRFDLEDGMLITGLGRISLYEPRGTYQVIVEYVEPKGIGALQVAFEQLKTRLDYEGLFDEQYKKPLPFLPGKISVITSPTGSVVYDIANIISRRFHGIHIEIIPVKVQGDGSDREIVSGLELINSRNDSDVIILARGGGSMEDLHAFNSENVARAIFSSVIPVISAVGHETDFTISDFVADLRAPTPSAAAELVTPQKKDLELRLAELSNGLKSKFYKYIQDVKLHLSYIAKQLVNPKKKIEDFILRIDDFNVRLIRIMEHILTRKSEHLAWRMDKLHAVSPITYTGIIKGKLDRISGNLLIYMELHLKNKRSMLRELSSKLHALSPLAILSRGYSITRTIPDGIVVKKTETVNIGQKLEVIIEKGTLVCRLERKSFNGQTDV